MDINGIGFQGLNSSRGAFTQNVRQVGEDGAFGDLLRRVQSSSLVAENAPAQRALNVPPVVQNIELYELCMELETILIKNLLTGMRNTVQKSGFIDTGFAGEIYEDMLWDEYAKTYARNAGLGFAEMAYRELSGNR